MLFIYNKCSKKLNLTVKMVGDTLQLHADDESGQNITFNIGKTTDANVLEKLNNRFSEGIVIEENPGRQFIKMDKAFVGYTMDNDTKETVMVEAQQLTHKPTEEERKKIIPRNIIVVVTDSDTTVWTHRNNIHPSFPVKKSNIGDLTFTVFVPKWNNWKVLKFPASILLENTKTGIKEKLVMTFSTHNRKDHTKYAMNKLELAEWDDEHDRILRPKQNNYGDWKKSNKNKKYNEQKNSSN